ncbi:hypothetical protein GLYMA_20G188700v4 [Glycine max]|uniref:Uncharacterized protein n=1 Tax=Glycine max TaxID=3847 RepID=A0A0R0ED56_SOYBN|nr:hypothetical protein GYH30_056331 [Glycine max]KRG92057.1 hypothetical protein GLYMA_20G188700v4 [Glycine max]
MSAASLNGRNETMVIRTIPCNKENYSFHHCVNGYVDKFSLLKETIPITNVSFLPFKDAVRTCVPSKKWSKIWKKINDEHRVQRTLLCLSS